jgi:hypothetical protein
MKSGLAHIFLLSYVGHNALGKYPSVAMLFTSAYASARGFPMSACAHSLRFAVFTDSESIIIISYLPAKIPAS